MVSSNVAAIWNNTRIWNMSRTVILHYHLFKNAGTSLDQILKRNFADRWVTAEFRMPPAGNTDEVADWIRANPEAVAFSTHTALGPVPQIDGVRVVSVMLLRDPVERVMSAYRFERHQQAETWGAELAKQHDLEGYVRTRLSRRGDRQCRNFQTHRLASLVPPSADCADPELDRALQAMDEVTVLGLVERFDDAVRHLATEIRDDCPDFSPLTARANTTTRSPETAMEQRVRVLLEEVNGDDWALLKAARRRVTASAA